MNLDLINAKLDDLANLPIDWDGYGAKPINSDTIKLVREVLDTVCTDATPDPQFVPGGDGSVQIEWHTMEGDVEILVEPDGEVVAWRPCPGDPEGEDREFGPEIADWVRAL